MMSRNASTLMIVIAAATVALTACQELQEQDSPDVESLSSALRTEYEDLEIRIAVASRKDVPVHYALFDHDDEKWGFELAGCTTAEDWKQLFGVNVVDGPSQIDVSEIVDYGFTSEGFSADGDTILSCDGTHNVSMKNDLLIDTATRHFYLQYKNDFYYKVPSECNGVKSALTFDNRTSKATFVETAPEASTIKLIGCVDDQEQNIDPEEEEEGNWSIAKIADYGFGEFYLNDPQDPSVPLFDAYFLIYRVDANRANDVYFPIYRVNGKDVYTYEAENGDRSLEGSLADAFGAAVAKEDLDFSDAFERQINGQLFKYPLIDACIGTCDLNSYFPVHFTVDQDYSAKLVDYMWQTRKRAGLTGDVNMVWEFATEQMIAFSGCEFPQTVLGLMVSDEAEKTWEQWADNAYAQGTIGTVASFPVVRCSKKICNRTAQTEAELKDALSSNGECGQATQIHVEIDRPIEMRGGSLVIDGEQNQRNIVLSGKNDASLIFYEGTGNCGLGTPYMSGLSVCDGNEVTLKNLELALAETAVQPPAIAVEINNATATLDNVRVNGESQKFDFGIEAQNGRAHILDSRVIVSKSALRLFDSKGLIATTDKTMELKPEGETHLSVSNVPRYEAIMAERSLLFANRAQIESLTPIAVKSSTIKGRFLKIVGGDSGRIALRVHPVLQGEQSSNILLQFPIIRTYTLLASISDPDAYVSIFMPFDLQYRVLRNAGNKGTLEIE